MAGRLPEAWLRDLLDRVDVTEVIGRHVNLRRNGKNLIGLCPFHDEKTPSFSVNRERGFYYCFGCGAHGTAIGFLMAHERLPFLEAVSALAEEVGLELPAQEQDEESLRRQAQMRALRTLLQRAMAWFQAQLARSREAQAYVQQRALPTEQLGSFCLGFAPERGGLVHQLQGEGFSVDQLLEAGLARQGSDGRCYDLFRGRLMFPIHDERGQLVGFGGRVLQTGDHAAQPKYLNTPETPLFHKSHCLYGLWQGRHANRLVLVEGYMDVLALAGRGLAGAVAPLGTALGARQATLLSRFTNELVLCFDGDEAGRRAARRAALVLAPYLGVRQRIGVVLLPPGDDPDSLVRRDGLQAFEARLATMTPLADYVLETIWEETSSNGVTAGAQQLHAAKPFLQALQDEETKAVLMAALAHRMGLSPERVERVLLGRENAAAGSRSVGEGARQQQDAVRKLRVLSLAERAMALLLMEPGLAVEMPAPDLPLGHEGAHGALQRILELIRQNPHHTTASLLEELRTEPAFQAFGHLGMAAGEVPPAIRRSEWLAVLGRLREEGRHRRIDILMDKMRRGTLDQQEMVVLNELLRRGAASGEHVLEPRNASASKGSVHEVTEVGEQYE
jgi:DNA primase